MTLELWLWTGYIFIIGLFFGSFFNVVGIRVPEKETLLGRSKCPKCDHTLGVIELLPIIGYLLLKGRCKNCHQPISVKYPIIEGLTALLFAVSFVILHQNMVEYILVVAFISLLIIVTVSDLYYQIVPDIILWIFGPVILVLRLFSNMPWYESIIGGTIAFLFMLLMSIYGKKRFKKEALGGGDIKLYFIIGLVLGYNTVFLSVFSAGILGLLYYAIVRPKGSYLPFVPFIAAGSLLAYFLGPAFIDWYISLVL